MPRLTGKVHCVYVNATVTVCNERFSVSMVHYSTVLYVFIHVYVYVYISIYAYVYT